MRTDSKKGQLREHLGWKVYILCSDSNARLTFGLVVKGQRSTLALPFEESGSTKGQNLQPLYSVFPYKCKRSKVNPALPSEQNMLISHLLCSISRLSFKAFLVLKKLFKRFSMPIYTVASLVSGVWPSNELNPTLTQVSTWNLVKNWSSGLTIS